MTMPFADYESEDDYDSESDDYEANYDDDGEDVRSDAIRRRRLARARRLRDQQRRAQTAVTVAPRPAPSTARQTVAAIRNLDLQTKVGQDSLRSAIERSKRRAARANHVSIASVAIAQVLDTFESDLAGHNIVRAGLRAAPLLALPPERRRPGIEGVLLDHRVIAGAAVAGILAVDRFRKHGDHVDNIVVDRLDVDSNAGSGTLFAVAVNNRGNDTGADVTWSSPGAAGFELSKDGTFKVKKVTSDTPVKVTATAGTTSRTMFIHLKP